MCLNAGGYRLGAGNSFGGFGFGDVRASNGALAAQQALGVQDYAALQGLAAGSIGFSAAGLHAGNTGVDLAQQVRMRCTLSCQALQAQLQWCSALTHKHVTLLVRWYLFPGLQQWFMCCGISQLLPKCTT